MAISTQKPAKKLRGNHNNSGFFFPMMNLPPQIILEILTRLPAKTIIQCKCVCKAWLDLISDRHFAAVHSSLSRPALIVHQFEMFNNFLRLIHFDETNGDHDHRNLLQHNTMLKLNFSSLSSFTDSTIVVDGSINGFLLLRDINYMHETMYVCNPLTREYFTLPKPEGTVRYPSVVTRGFGVTPIRGDYKVVRIFHERVLNPVNGSCLRIPYLECQVYTLGTGAWRRVGHDASFVYDSRKIGVFFKGNLHWLVRDLESGDELISRFDLENESFRPFSSPFTVRKCIGSLGVLKDCLCLCDNTSHFEIDVWVMKEYGVEKSWAKEYVVKKMPELVGPFFQNVCALKVTGNGDILLMWGDFFMMYYCSKSGDAAEVDLDQPRGPNSIEAIHHIPSFVRLRTRFVMENVCTF